MNAMPLHFHAPAAASREARQQSSLSSKILRVTAAQAQPLDDVVAVEEPLEIRVVSAGEERRVTVTMRTPGADAELAAGFLSAEGVVRHRSEIIAIRPCAAQPNLLRVELAAECMSRLQQVERNFVATSSCGLCGKTSLESVFAALPEPLEVAPVPFSCKVLQQLPASLRRAQAVFDRTGGLHAVAAFTRGGELQAIFEDVGRHNAFDKLVGAAVLAGDESLQHCIVTLSGRAGFELVQKAAMARLPLLAAIGAPSSLAVELAQRVGITLVGFLGTAGFNVYSHPGRLALAAGSRAGQS